MPLISCNSASVVGGFEQSSSSDESCITTNDGTLCSCDVRRRHSFMYSRNSGFAVGADAGETYPAGKEYFLRRVAETVAPNWSHGGRHPQKSQESQVVHLGVSPKCRQIWRCRHALDSTKFLIW